MGRSSSAARRAASFLPLAGQAAVREVTWVTIRSGIWRTWSWRRPAFVDTPTLPQEANSVPKTRARYAPEFPRQMFDLVRAGSDPDDLAREFGLTAQSIRNWVAVAGAKVGGRVEKSSARGRRRTGTAVPRGAAAPPGARRSLESGGLVRARARHAAVRIFGSMSEHHREAILRKNMPRSGVPQLPDHGHARVLRMSTAGYYAWLKRVPSAHAEADATLLQRIRTVHATLRAIYGVPRVHAELWAGGRRHGRKRIARQIREAGLVGVSRRRGGAQTTRRDREARPAPDLVDPNFSANGPKCCG